MRCARTIASTAVASVVLTLTGLVSVVPAAHAATASLVDEPFTGTSTNSSSWVLPAASVRATNNGACLAASGDTSSAPIPGCASSGGTAGLQSTTADETQEGGLAYSFERSVISRPRRESSPGYQYAGTAADGIVFFLAASLTPPTRAPHR